MRTRKVSVLLQDDAAVQFDMLATILGLPGQHRKQSDADVALVRELTNTYQQLVQAQLKRSGKSWCDITEVQGLLASLLDEKVEAVADTPESR